VSDRIAQTVVKLYLEPRLESIFHPDSYGYRPGRSALDAIAVTRKRCWKKSWVVEFDIMKAFDSLYWNLLRKVLQKHVKEKWILMYIDRWLTAAIVTPTGEVVKPQRGVPQGSVIGPLLMNLFMHYAFDLWMDREHPSCPFARYADDSVIHCGSLAQAERLLASLTNRLLECGLEIHPEKYAIVFCKDTARSRNYPNTSFTFLGYTFRPRTARTNKQGKTFVGFLPGVSRDAMKQMRATIRSWKLHKRSDLELGEIAGYYDPVIRGWWNYYARFYKSEMLQGVIQYFHKKLMQWVRRKYHKLKCMRKASRDWMVQATRKAPRLLFSARLQKMPLAG
jgi:group II intron reverse transcriptase/maturase